MKRVAVLRGGPSKEYDVSMRTGLSVIEALKKLGYPHRDVVITKNGHWLQEGMIREPERLLDTVDVAFIALHGEFGEDGQIQRILERRRVPFTGSRALPSAIAFNKDLTKKTLSSLDLKMAKHYKVSRDECENLDETVRNIIGEVGNEVFIKPISAGSSIGARYAPNKESLRSALLELLEENDQVMVEEFIRGREATVGVLNDFRNEKLYALPVVEIVLPKSDNFYSNTNKYDGSTSLICPGRFTYHEKAKLADMARLVHDTVGCSQYSRSDFIIRDKDIYFLEINTLPGLTTQSNFPRASASVGLEFPDLVQHLVETATV